MNRFNKNLIVTALAIAIVGGLGGFGLAQAAGPLPVDLKTASNFVVLGKTTITTTGATTITGNIGLSPAAASFITGFGLVMDSSNQFSNSSLVTGKVYAANYSAPTPAVMTQAITDMQAAYVDAAGRAGPTSTDLAGGIISGLTFAPGLYKWNTDVSMAASATTSTDVNLVGGPTDVWIFQMTGNLNVADGGSIGGGAKVVLSGGALPENVFWQVGGGAGAILGTYSTFKGNILTLKDVVMKTGAVLSGKALAQAAVTLDANTISFAGTAPATLNVIKLVDNALGMGTSAPSDFLVSVKSGGVDIAGSPTAGTSAPGASYSVSVGTYVVSEVAVGNYIQTFAGDCDAGGSVTLAAGETKTCTIINTTPAGYSTGAVFTQPALVPPLINVVKIPTPLALPGGAGSVTYDYTVINVGTVAMNNIIISDDKCSSITFVSGDSNSDSKLDVNEVWKYRCTTNLAQTTTNTVTVSGQANGFIATDFAHATVVVGVPIAPPLINVIKKPSAFVLPFAGPVTYTYTVTNPGVVSLSDVRVTDNKCSPVYGPIGDVNNNNLLDVGEVWVYSCQMNLTTNTVNTATAIGKANGLTAIDYSIATVIVSTPVLPSTGISPDKNIFGYVAALFGILMLASTSVLVISRKRKV